MDRKGQVALITGASGGIGKAIASHLHASGVRLVLAGSDPRKLSAVTAELQGAIGIDGDIVDLATPKAMIDAALKSFGRLDIVINNAGVMRVGTIEEVDVEKLCQMIRVNFEAVVRLSYAAVRHFKTAGSGFLVNTSSIAGYKTVPHLGVYNGTKFAVEAFTDSLRLELAGTNIRVSAIAPGTVETGLYTGWDQAHKDVMHSGGALQPTDVARAVAFILDQPQNVLIPRLLIVPAAQPV